MLTRLFNKLVKNFQERREMSRLILEVDPAAVGKDLERIRNRLTSLVNALADCPLDLRQQISLFTAYREKEGGINSYVDYVEAIGAFCEKHEDPALGSIRTRAGLFMDAFETVEDRPKKLLLKFLEIPADDPFRDQIRKAGPGPGQGMSPS